MHPVDVVFRKEMRDGIRDKRAVLSAMLFPVLGPVLVYFMLTTIIDLRGKAEETIIPVQGAGNAPHLIQFLREQNVKIEDFEGDAETAVKDKTHELVIIIREDFGKRIAQTRTAVVEIVSDGSRTDSLPAVNRLRGLIRRYNSEVAALRLIARGVSPEVMRVVTVQDIEVASKQQIAARMLNIIPMYIILAAFVSGMGIAVDSTAGERERGSLEPLLINPVERHEIVMGKWFASSFLAAVGIVLTLILCLTAMTFVPLEELGLTFSISTLQISGMIAATLPLAFLATSMQMLLGIFAKSFKDAQSYIGLLIILPMVPSLYTIFNPIATKTWMFSVPLLSQQLLLVDVMGGKDIPVIAYLLAGGTSLITGLLLVMVTARLFRRESIIFS